MLLSSPYVSEVDYQERLDDDTVTPRFPENDQWPKTSGGLPLKERFLQLLCGAEDSEFQQYGHAIDRWSLGATVPQRKRAFDLFERDVSSSCSERSHPTRSKRRCDGAVGRLLRAGGEGDSASGSG